MQSQPPGLFMMLLPLIMLPLFLGVPFICGYFIGKGRGYKQGIEAVARLSAGKPL